MSFLRAEKKKSGTYLRIVKSFKINGKVKHKTLHSLGKAEDYSTEQLEKIAKKLLELAGINLEDIVARAFHEVRRVNYGYGLIIRKLWQMYDMKRFVRQINANSRLQFDWQGVLQLMVAERINEPVSKRQNYFHKDEYLGFNQAIDLQYFYRTLDVLAKHQHALKKHLFEQRRSLYSQELDVVFYDVTTLYFDSQKEVEGNIRHKGYSKDGKAHKTQVVLGLLVDKLRNPITYHIYQGNTYEGHTMTDALKDMKENFPVDRVIVVADSAMIDKDNRDFMEENGFDYILGDRLKNLPGHVKNKLLDAANHQSIASGNDKFTYAISQYKGRKIFCTYSSKRARKDAQERDKLIEKARKWLEEPSKYKQAKKRGAGRFLQTDQEGIPKELDQEKIKADARFDGYKAIATTTDLSVKQIISRYGDLYEVEHAFRTLKSQLEIRPIYHWTNRRIEGHIAMCFLAYTFLNYLRNKTALSYKTLVKALDRMQMSEIEEEGNQHHLYMRSALKEEEHIILKHLKLAAPKDVTPKSIINQYFT